MFPVSLIIINNTVAKIVILVFLMAHDRDAALYLNQVTDYQPMSSERNVVILGKVGTGKRTLGNHIVDEKIFESEGSLGAGNVTRHYHEQRTKDVIYRILIVDTESLQIGYCNPLPFIQERFQTINLIIFVIANGRYTDESHSSLLRVVKTFDPRAKPFSALVITHCEGITREKRLDFIDDFQHDPRSSKIAAFMGKDVRTVGFPNISKVSPNLKPIYENGIAEDEKAIRELVNECNSSLRVSELPMNDYQVHWYHSEHSSSQQHPHKAYQKTLESQETSLRYNESCRQMDLNPSYSQTETQTDQGSTVMVERNVVILGKVGTGKRTLGNHIVGQSILQSKSVLAASNVTRHYYEQRTEDTMYRILIVDTEGLQIGYCNPLPFIQEHFQTINLIIFVIANGRYTDESHSSLLRVVKTFDPRAKPFSALVITHCEGITREKRLDFIDDFQHDPRSSKIAAFMGKDVRTVGFPNISKVSPNLKPIYENGIAEDEKAIRELVNECNSSLRVSELPMNDYQVHWYHSEHSSSQQHPHKAYQKTLESQETSLRYNESCRQMNLNPSYLRETPAKVSMTSQGVLSAKCDAPVLTSEPSQLMSQRDQTNVKCQQQ